MDVVCLGEAIVDIITQKVRDIRLENEYHIAHSSIRPVSIGKSGHPSPGRGAAANRKSRTGVPMGGASPVFREITGTGRRLCPSCFTPPAPG